MKSSQVSISHNISSKFSKFLPIIYELLQTLNTLLVFSEMFKILWRFFKRLEIVSKSIKVASNSLINFWSSFGLFQIVQIYQNCVKLSQNLSKLPQLFQILLISSVLFRKCSKLLPILQHYITLLMASKFLNSLRIPWRCFKFF